MDVGMIGLGAMGAPMAENLARAGHHVRAWNRTRGGAPEGVELTDTPAMLGSTCEVVLVMVADEDAVRQVLFGPDGATAEARPGLTVVQSSTIGPDAARAIAAELDGLGIACIDAPVSGSVAPARAGELTVLAGGEAEHIDALAPVFDAIASKVLHLGPVGTGSAAKLVVNATLIAVMAAAGETLTWAADAEPELSQAALATALERVSPLAAKRADALTGDAPLGGFALRHVVKDLDLITAAMAPAGVLAAVRELALEAVAGGLGDRDVSALGRAARHHRTD
jgi:3-hydroxyisobutyrate dehydrogenase-like beta-hydroxyacid dehydrogenase